MGDNKCSLNGSQAQIILLTNNQSGLFINNFERSQSYFVL